MARAQPPKTEKSRGAAPKSPRPGVRGAAVASTQRPGASTRESPLGEAASEMRTFAEKMLKSAAAAAARGLRDATGAQEGRKQRMSVGRVLTGARAIGAAAKAANSLRPKGSNAAPRSTWGKAGAKVRELREQAGMTLQEVGKAVDLKDPDLLAAAEQGRAALPFEMILRLSAVLGRKDPLTALVTLTRTSYPQVWETLESMGIGKLVLQSSREREFVNLLVADDRTRGLNDREFAELLAFLKSCIELVLAFNDRVRVAK